VISPSVKNHWTKVAFGDVVRNANLTEHDPEAAGLDRIVGLEHLDPENLHIRRWNTLENSTSFSRKFVPGQTLFGKRRAYQRKVAFAEFEGICSGDILTFEPEDPDVLLPELLPFICQTDAFFEHALGTSAGSLSPRTSWRALQDFEFPLPPIEEQKRIAEILWAADEVSERHSNTLAWVERLQRVAMAESFRRDSSNLTLRAATDVCEKITVGIVIKPASYYVKDGGIPALRSLNVFPQRFDLQELVYISEEGHSKNQKSELHSGDVVIVRTGRPGDACVIRAEQAGFNAIDLIIARPGKDILPDYLSAFVNSDLAKRQFNRGIAGTAQTHFNIGEFKKLKISMVSVDKQGELLRDLQAIQTITSDISKHLLATQQLKRTLLNSLLWQASDV
jgi:type I restriction enzyme S subunit